MGNEVSGLRDEFINILFRRHGINVVLFVNPFFFRFGNWSVVNRIDILQKQNGSRVVLAFDASSENNAMTA